MIICNRLQKLRQNKGLTQRQTALDLGITERAYQGYEINDVTPSLKMFVKLCNYFNVSADYLLGLSDNPKRNE